MESDDKRARHLRVTRARMLILMNRLQNAGRLHIYGGTVSPEDKAQRRAANKRARKSRRANR